MTKELYHAREELKRTMPTHAAARIQAQIRVVQARLRFRASVEEARVRSEAHVIETEAPGGGEGATLGRRTICWCQT